MKIRTHYTSYVTLATYKEAVELCQYAKSLGISFELPPKNDGKKWIMRFPNCMGELDCIYRITSHEGEFEASKVTELPKQCFTWIALDENDECFDICEYNNANTFGMMRAMQKASYKFYPHIRNEERDMYRIQNMLEGRGEKGVELYLPSQKEAKTWNTELPVYCFGVRFSAVYVVKVLHQEQTPIYSVMEVWNEDKKPVFKFITEWKLSLIDALNRAEEHFSCGSYDHFWNQYGGEIKFDTPRISGKCNPDAAYKIGDKVKIKSFEWYNMLADKYGNIEFEDEDGDFGTLMSEYCGKVMTITGKKCSSQYTLDLTSFWWPDWCFEKVEDEVDYYPSTFTKRNGTAKTYLMHDENIHYTKIGKSVNPKHREKTLQGEKPTITMFAVCENDVEKKLHVKYADKRIRGEWFDLTQEDIDNIVNEYGFELQATN